MRLEPANPVARESLAYLRLTLGDFEHGLEEYEARLRRLDAHQRAAERGTPQWNGEDLAGKRLLVLTEQGLGDTIQFSRYLSMLRERGRGNHGGGAAAGAEAPALAVGAGDMERSAA